MPPAGDIDQYQLAKRIVLEPDGFYSALLFHRSITSRVSGMLFGQWKSWLHYCWIVRISVNTPHLRLI